MGEEGAKAGMAVHGNEYHDPDFSPETALTDHAAATSGVHGVGAGTVAKVGDIAVDANLSDAAQDAIARKHTQGTDNALGTLGTKNPPVDADLVVQRNSAGAWALFTSTWTQIKAYLKLYWDTLYDALGAAAAAVSTHAALTTGIHGVGAGTVAKVGDIAVDANLSAAAQDAITKRHTQNTDKVITDADADTKIQVEESADEDKIHMDVKGVEAFLLSDTGILTLAKQSAARAWKDAADQTISYDTVTKVVLEAETFDIQGEYDKVTNYRFTAIAAGLYLCVAALDYEPVVDGNLYQVRLYKNGAFLAACNAYAVGTVVASPVIVQVVSLAATDYIEVYAYHQQTGTATLVKAWDGNWFVIAKIA